MDVSNEKVRIVSDGTGRGTRILLSDGRDITKVGPNRIATVEIVCIGIDVELEGQVQP
jgi:hypothetical protein